MKTGRRPTARRASTTRHSGTARADAPYGAGQVLPPLFSRACSAQGGCSRRSNSLTHRVSSSFSVNTILPHTHPPCKLVHRGRGRGRVRREGQSGTRTMRGQIAWGQARALGSRFGPARLASMGQSWTDTPFTRFGKVTWPHDRRDGRKPRDRSLVALRPAADHFMGGQVQRTLQSETGRRAPSPESKLQRTLRCTWSAPQFARLANGTGFIGNGVSTWVEAWGGHRNGRPAIRDQCDGRHRALHRSLQSPKPAKSPRVLSIIDEESLAAMQCRALMVLHRRVIASCRWQAAVD